MKNICVLLSTYNSEKYLLEQIESVLLQKDINLTLSIRDDGSKDGTKDILKKYENRSNVAISYGNNVGFKNSFYELCKTAPKSDYYAFCDHDDIWYDNKLISAINKIESCKADELPCLCYSALKVMDIESGKVYAENSHKKISIDQENPFLQALLINLAYGCTCVFNKKARELYLLANPEEYKYHDYFMNLLCCACGKVSLDEVPSMIYRQHSNNTVGFYKSNLKNFIKSLKILFNEQMKNSRQELTKVLYANYSNFFTTKNKEIANLVINYTKDKKVKKALIKAPAVQKASSGVRKLGKLLIKLNRF